MKIFLTGITGFLGQHVAEALSAAGHEIYAFLRQPEKMRASKISFQAVTGSLNDCNKLTPVLSQMDAVIHLAGQIKALKRKEFYETNQKGTKRLIQAILAASPKPPLYIHISTIAVVGPKQDQGNFCKAPEECHSVSWYGDSKRLGEIETRALRGKVRSVILRPPVLYGPYDRELLALFKAVRAGIAPLYSKGKNELSICYATDVADCILSFLKNPPAQDEIYCLDDGKTQSWRSLALQVAEAMKKKPLLLPIPPLLFKIGAFLTQSYAQLSGKAQIFTLNKIKEMSQLSWVCGFEKLKQTRGWKPKVSLEEGIKTTEAFYKKVGWL